MTDIIKCDDNTCPYSIVCYRFTSPPSLTLQKYFVKSPLILGPIEGASKCPKFWADTDKHPELGKEFFDSAIHTAPGDNVIDSINAVTKDESCEYIFTVGDDYPTEDDNTMFTAGINVKPGGKADTHWNSIEINIHRGDWTEEVAENKAKALRDFILSKLVPPISTNTDYIENKIINHTWKTINCPHCGAKHHPYDGCY